MKQHEDHRFIEGLRQADQQLIRQIYKEYSLQVIDWVLKNSGTRSDAKDVFQDALMAIYEKAADPSFRLSCPFGALLFAICRNKWIDQLRKKNTQLKVREEVRERWYEDEQMVPIVETIEQESHRQRLLESTFVQLSELCQKILQLVADGVAPAKMAADLEMNEVNTVYRRKKACIDRWRELYHHRKPSF